MKKENVDNLIDYYKAEQIFIYLFIYSFHFIFHGGGVGRVWMYVNVSYFLLI